jgi:hypothetical protein
MAVQKTRTQIILAAACLGLLLSIGSARAQTEHLLTMSVHRDVPPKLMEQLTNEVDVILQETSTLMSESKCDVTFKLAGPIKPFTSAAPKDILDKDDLEAVHREVADIKVVDSVGFCVGKKGKFEGCAWRRDGSKTVIVAIRPLLLFRAALLAHEFGHTTGLVHRTEPKALMRCRIDHTHRKINATECSCIRAGPGSCKIPEPDPAFACSEDQQ